MWTTNVRARSCHYDTITANSPPRHAREKQSRISAPIFLSRITYIAYTRYVCESWPTTCGPSSPPSERVHVR
jgi:hypothetical protein